MKFYRIQESYFSVVCCSNESETIVIRTGLKEEFSEIIKKPINDCFDQITSILKKNSINIQISSIKDLVEINKENLTSSEILLLSNKVEL